MTDNQQRGQHRYDVEREKSHSVVVEGNSRKRRIIYIHGLFELRGKECRKYPEAGLTELTAANLAIDHVNKMGILPGYQLTMYTDDTECDSGVAIDAFFRAIYRRPQMTMVLGTGSSEVTERLARVVSYWNVVQVSYGAVSPTLSDKSNFPLFYRTVAPDSSHSAAIQSAMRHFKWDTVATLHEHGDSHALPIYKLVTDLEQANISVTLTKGLNERDYREHLYELKVMDCRIIIGSFSISMIRKVFCEVYHLGMYGADYAWILQGNLEAPWWRSPEGTDCTDSQLSQAAEGHWVVRRHDGIVGNATSVSRLTTNDVLRKVRKKPDDHMGFVTQAYDAIWTIALAMKRAEEMWEANTSGVHLGDFSYEKKKMAEDMAFVMSKLQFMGVSGPVSFQGPDRIGITAFYQNQGGRLRRVSLYFPNTGHLDFFCNGCVPVVWQGGSVPIARRIIVLRIAAMDRTVFVCMTSLAVFGVALAVGFLTFNLYYRRYKFIKLSSPNLNNFAVVGCVLVYVAIVLLGTDHGTLVADNHFSFICTARAFLLSGGFSLAFGCMFIKTYRVYHIFIRASTGIVKSKLLHDQQLLGIVSVLVLIDCVIITLWVTVDPMERHLRNLTMMVSRTDRNVVYQEQREQCHSVHMVKWLGALYIYKGLLLVVGCYMAWETRHVKIPALNDSQYIGMSVYNVVITSVIVVALANVIPVQSYTLTFVVVAGLIFISTTTTLCLLFVPKIHTIWRNQEEDTVVATPGVKVECNTRRFVIDEPRECVYRAEVLNRALMRDIIELDKEISRLSCIAQEVGVPMFDRPWTADPTNDGEDSDDGLPPWISEYRDHSSVASDITPHEIWLTANDRVVSSMSNAVTPHLSPATIRESNHPKLPIVEKSNTPCDHLRGSLPTIATVECPSPLNLSPYTPISRPVRGCHSDRAINKCRVSDRCLELSPLKWLKAETTGSDVKSDSCLPVRKKISQQKNIPLTKYPSCDSNANVNRSSAKCGSPATKISSLEGARSIASEATASESVYTTAPLYCSTSFSTPEEFTQSLRRPSEGGNGEGREGPVEENRTPSVSSLETDTATGGVTVEDDTATSCATTVGEDVESPKDEEKQRRICHLRNQIFQLERDLILLQIDNSASVDL